MHHFTQLLRLLIFSLLWLQIGCGGGYIQKTELCTNCPPDRCIEVSPGIGECVRCIRDDHCQTPALPTQRCTKDNQCVCGTDQDCPTNTHCAGQYGCVTCTQDKHCEDPAAPYCIQQRCQACKTGSTQTCQLQSTTYCSRGQQVCTVQGKWGVCKELEKKQCQVDEVCINGDCECKSGLTRCGKDCVDLKANGTHCGSCGNTCPQNTRCASGRCVSECPALTPTACQNACANTSNDPSHCGVCDKTCQPGEVCLAGACQCPAGMLLCDGRCIDPSIDAKHCGACSNACKTGSVCASGACIQSCPKSTPTTCYGGCVDTHQNPLHCGTCGNGCRNDQVCQSGQCACPSQQTECTGECVDTDVHPSHCGSCGLQCKKGEICSGGKCILRCPQSTPTACYGGCVDTQSNTAHCGACGAACKKGQRCDKGVCVCPTGRKDCNGFCVDTSSHRLHCGACQKACANNELCDQGTCVSKCQGIGKTECYGACVGVDSNPSHCGSCGTACPATQICSKGTCSCATGMSLCGTQCVDIQSEIKHCGACGRACKESESCVQGLCIYQGCPTQRPKECGTNCVDPTTNVNHCGACNNACKAGETCQSGKCLTPDGCKAPETKCGTTCVNTVSNPLHCGACNSPCKAGEVCNVGLCGPKQCNAPQVACGTNCVDPTTDANHCGACNNACKAGETCQSGACKAKTCPPSQTLCGNDCVDLQTSNTHCGSCGTACKTYEACQSGLCKSTCLTPKQVCANVCVDTSVDVNNCGSCGKTCKAGELCQSGACKTKTCPPSQTLCGSACVDLQTNSLHCGTCNTSCRGNACVGGVCQQYCAKTQCGAICADILSDINNCGGCGLKCKAGEACQSGICTTTCASPTTLCGSSCVDTRADSQHCGACNQACTSGKNCCNGVCANANTNTETCNGRDDNCDGRIDEVCTWMLNITSASSSLNLRDIAADANNVYLAGTFQGTVSLGNNNLTSVGADDIFIAKLDKTGSIIWFRQYGGTGRDDVFKITPTTKGLYVSGHFQNSITLDNKTFTSLGSRDLFHVKLNDSGQLLWSKHIGSTSDEYYCTHLIHNNDVYLLGQMAGPITVDANTLTLKGKNDIYVAKYDTSGGLKWLKQGHETNGSVGWAYMATDGTTLYITLESKKEFTFNNTKITHTGDEAGILLAVNTQGSVSWHKKYVVGGGQFNRINVPNVTADKNAVYLSISYTGQLTFDGKTYNKTQYAEYDGLIAKVSPTGTALWDVQLKVKQYGDLDVQEIRTEGTSLYVHLSIEESFSINNTTYGSSTSRSTEYGSLSFDASGNVTWSKFFFNSSSTAIWLDSTSYQGKDFYFAGEHPGLLQVGTKNYSHQGKSAVFIFKGIK
ncbi:MAG: hypothetical protein CL920_22640 [Deltaproteobacteria bacterium]|nr:hypothetical protein [Deltaproteobacteria bacterium]